MSDLTFSVAVVFFCVQVFAEGCFFFFCIDIFIYGIYAYGLKKDINPVAVGEDVGS